MKKSLASLEIGFLVREMAKQLKNAKISRIYGSGKHIALVFHSASTGKSVANLIVPNFLYMSEAKFALETTGFGLKLRKHLENAKLIGVEQIKSERIVEFGFEKEAAYKLFVELFSKGNIILCDGEGKILAAAEHQQWSTRTIKPGFVYKTPEAKTDIYNLKKEAFEEAIKQTNKESIVKFLAVDLGLSGVYGEEACLRAGVDKNKKPSEAADKEKDAVFEAIKGLIEEKPNPAAVLRGTEIVDAVPFELNVYSGLEKKPFEIYSSAVEFAFPKGEVSETQSRINNIKRIISEQEEKIARMETDAEINRKKGELIYENYAKVKSALSKGKYGKVSIEL